MATIVPVLPAAEAAPGEDQTPIENPDLDRACGLDVMVILDASTSIAISNATENVRDAYRAFITSLNNTGSSVATVEFASWAVLPEIGGSPGGTYVTIDDTTAPEFDDYVTDDYEPDGYTNWEDAMRVGRFFAPRPSASVPHLVVFITDGDPTAYIRTDRVTQSEYRTKVPLDSDEVRTNQSENASLGPAIPNANGLKAAGSHILAIGVGSALQNQNSVDRLIDMSGPDVFDGTGTFDISTHDVYLEPDFSLLEDALRETAFQLCAPSVSIRKLVDFTPDPDSIDDAVPGTGFEGEGTVTNMTAAEFDWVLPADADQGSTTATAVTDAAGFATFQWTPNNPSMASDFEVIETSDFPGVEPVLGTCTYRTPDIPDTDFPFTVIDEGSGPIGFALEDIPPESIVTCQIVNITEPAPSMTIEKYTNGVDADDPTGPFIPVGEDVEWTYVVTNTGNLTLSDLEVTDDPAQTISCPTDTLAQGEQVVCTAGGTAEAGQYANTATATAVDSYGDAVGPVTDPSHYFGDFADIEIEKFTVVTDPFELRADADTYIDEDGNVIAPLIPVGTEVSWEYEVTNPGNVTLEDVSVVDSQGVVVTCPQDTLAPDETITCTGGPELATAGAYENFGTVTAVDPAFPADELIDSDPSHYLGYEFDVDIVKYTNGRDANEADGSDAPIVRAGDTVHWTYEVTNTGNVPLTDLVVTDDQGVAVTCPDEPDPLLPGAGIVCEATGTALDTGPDDPYANVGEVLASAAVPPGVTLPDGHPLIDETVTADDPSHYIGLNPAITIEKATNGDDADVPTGPFIPVGGAVAWTYEVTNSGSAPLTSIVAVDYRADGGVSILTCDDTALDPAETMTCTIPAGSAVAGQFVNFSGVLGLDPFGRRVGDIDPSHYFGAAPGIHIEKYTNGLDADEAPGAYIEVGDPVDWTYVVTNTGNDTLTAIEVTDDPAQTITCPTDTLDPGEEMTCTASGVAVAGQYQNLATAQGSDGTQNVEDDDPSHYFGYTIEIAIEKATNGEDADDPTGPVVGIGSTVTWTYVVTNPGDVPITDVLVVDDKGVVPAFQGGDTNGDDRLDPDETWTYEATGIAEIGQYENTGTVTGLAGFELGVEVTDSDPSHYLGVEAAIQIEKTPDLTEVPRGNPHTFTIEVTNIGTVPLTDVEVTDPVTPSCDSAIGDMAPGEVVTYECDVDAVFETIDNTAFVEGADPQGGTVTDQDDARVVPVDVGGTSIIGDTVWRDNNGNGVQDPGEPGIAGARVRVRTISDTPFAQGSSALDLTIDQTLVTDSDGNYLEVALVAGTYEVTLDLSSVSGSLTTAQEFVVPLDVGQTYLDADFGLRLDDLPFTGFEVSRLIVIALSLLLLGSGLVLSTRYRRQRGPAPDS